MAQRSLLWYLIISLIAYTNGSQTSKSDISAFLKSKKGIFGDMSDFIYCDDGHYANGIEYIVEPDQGSGDDTSANGFRLQCTDGYKLYAENDGNWGDITYTKYCDDSELIYGFSTKVEDACGSSCDDTALNSISGYCTDNSRLILNPNSEWVNGVNLSSVRQIPLFVDLDSVWKMHVVIVMILP